MAISIIDNLEYSGKKFLDARQSFETLAEMHAVLSSTLPEGFLAFCKEDKKYYVFKDNFWKEFVADSGVVISEYNKDENSLTLLTNDSNELTEIILNKIIANVESEILNRVYPIGSVYIGIGNKQPNFGQWEKIKSGLTLWSDNTGDGREITAGLPNITGLTYSGNRTTSGDMTARHMILSASGAFYATDNVQTYDHTTLTNKSTVGNKTLGFDASKSNAIYGASSTVQPPAIAVSMWKRIS